MNETNEIRSIGSQMANIMYNLSQGASLPVETRDLMREMHQRWDAAISADRGPPPQSHVMGSEAEKIALLEEQIAGLEDELDEARQVPWPEWSIKILKLVRSYSGYDGYDDATEGVDLVAEVEEALSELQSEAEKLRNAAPAVLLVGSDALRDVAAERRRQVEVEGWTPEHDDQHTDGSMAQAAAAYALKARSDESHANGVRIRPPYLWPDTWHPSWWKPKDRRRDLVRAAALIIAEIERLDRSSATEIQS